MYKHILLLLVLLGCDSPTGPENDPDPYVQTAQIYAGGLSVCTWNLSEPENFGKWIEGGYYILQVDSVYSTHKIAPPQIRSIEPGWTRAEAAAYTDNNFSVIFKPMMLGLDNLTYTITYNTAYCLQD